MFGPNSRLVSSRLGEKIACPNVCARARFIRNTNLISVIISAGSSSSSSSLLLLLLLLPLPPLHKSERCAAHAQHTTVIHAQWARFIMSKHLTQRARTHATTYRRTSSSAIYITRRTQTRFLCVRTSHRAPFCARRAANRKPSGRAAAAAEYQESLLFVLMIARQRLLRLRRLLLLLLYRSLAARSARASSSAP